MISEGKLLAIRYTLEFLQADMEMLYLSIKKDKQLFRAQLVSNTDSSYAQHVGSMCLLLQPPASKDKIYDEQCHQIRSNWRTVL